MLAKLAAACPAANARHAMASRCAVMSLCSVASMRTLSLSVHSWPISGSNKGFVRACQAEKHFCVQQIGEW